MAFEQWMFLIIVIPLTLMFIVGVGGAVYAWILEAKAASEDRKSE